MANFRKPNAIWVTAMILSIALLTVGCLSNGGKSGEDSLLSFKSLNGMMGKEKGEVLDTLKLNSEADVTVETIGDEERYTVKEPLKVQGKESKVLLTFYKSYLSGFIYTFDDVESGYDLAKQIRSEMEELYGEPTTYPISDKRLDNLESVADIDVSETGADFFEEWLIEDTKELIEKMFDGTEPERLNMMLRLNCRPNGVSTVTVRYSAIRKSLR